MPSKSKTKNGMSETETIQSVSRSIILEGLRPLMTDRYAGKGVELRPYEKLYFLPDLRTVCLPAINIKSFLCAQNTPSAVKRFNDPRKYLKLALAIQSFLEIDPELIAITRNGKRITLNNPLESGRDEDSGIYIHNAVARLKGGIPNDKVRPVIELPWEVEFGVTIYQNDEGCNERMVHDLFVRGGLAIGLGTWRGSFGKFQVSKWE